MLYSVWRVGGADEGHQGDGVLPGEIAQDIIGANLWTGVQGIWEYLGQEQNFWHAISDYYLSTFASIEPLKILLEQRA